MDPSIFGLDGHPFETESPRPDDTVLFEAQASLLAELRAGLKTPQGILVLVGESGMGKSALVSGLAERLGEATVHAYLPECGPGLRGVLTEAIEQLSAANGSEVGQAGDKHLAGTVRDMAKANAAKGKSTLIVIDDAHLLPAKTIERLAQMFPKDPAAPSRLHLLLVGRPELLDRINAAGDRSVLRYLVQVCRMDRIGPEDSFRYIAERITRAGGTVEKVFNEDALSSIVQEAGGLPARLNTLCKTALEHAAASGARKVSPQTLAKPHTPAADTEGEAEPAQPRDTAPAANRRRMGIWAAGLLALVIGFAAALSTDDESGGGPVNAGLEAAPLAIVVGEDTVSQPPANPPAIAKLALLRSPVPEVKKKPAPAPPKAVPARPRPVVAPQLASRPAPRPAKDRVVAGGKLPVAPLAAAIDDVKKKLTHSFAIQLGAFRTEANADKLVARMAGRGLKNGRVEVDSSGGVSVYRVLSGSFATATEARRQAKALAGKGFSTYVKRIEP